MEGGDIFHDFLGFISKAALFDDAKLDTILACLQPEEAKKNTILLVEGQVCRKFYFLNKGIVRIFYRTLQGREKTRLVLFENSPFTSLLSFITEEPSIELIEVLEESEMLSMPRAQFFQLVKDIPEWATLYRIILERTYIYQNTRLAQLATLSATQRYQKIMHDAPHFIQRLSNGVLASYLDISQETLSRLKSK